MLVTLLGMRMLVRFVQNRNAEVPMLVTLGPIVTLVRPVQELNALYPMLVTLSGIVTLVTSNVLRPSEGLRPGKVPTCRRRHSGGLSWGCLLCGVLCALDQQAIGLPAPGRLSHFW
jgi:hypothetical protein